MKNKALKLIPVIFVLLSSQLVLGLGVTQPVPLDLELMRGESSDFRFQIQATTSASDVTCDYNMRGMEGLVIEFNQEQITIEAGSKERVYGTVTVPEDAEYGQYSGELSVSCGPSIAGGGGSKIKTTISGSPFKVKVVSERGVELESVREEVGEEVSKESIVLIVTIAIVLVGVYYLLERSKSSAKNKFKKKKGTEKRKKKKTKKRK